jgi:hypothetical protein
MSQLKTKPCGQTANKRTTDKVTTFSPGQKVEIKIKEYINHPGYFAVAFDPDGDDSFVFPRENPDKVVAASDDPKTLFPVDGVKGWASEPIKTRIATRKTRARTSARSPSPSPTCPARTARCR